MTDRHLSLAQRAAAADADLVPCEGAGREAGDSYPGLAPRRTCPWCGAMPYPDDDGRLPVHPRATTEDLAHLAAIQQCMLFIVFNQADTWQKVRPFVTADLEEAVAERDRRLVAASSSHVAYLTGVTRPDMARRLAGLDDTTQAKRGIR